MVHLSAVHARNIGTVASLDQPPLAPSNLTKHSPTHFRLPHPFSPAFTFSSNASIEASYRPLPYGTQRISDTARGLGRTINSTCQKHPIKDDEKTVRGAAKRGSSGRSRDLENSQADRAGWRGPSTLSLEVCDSFSHIQT